MTAFMRFGIRELSKAEEYAQDIANDGQGVVHIVEVFDEDTVYNEREGVEMGPLFVVKEEHLAEFLDDHFNQASVIDSMGINPNEQEEV